MKVGPLASGWLAVIPAFFHDDGCSGAPDRILWWNVRHCCRIHDFFYCTRGWPPGVLDQAHRSLADRLLGELVREALPAGLKWLGWAYYRAVHRLGGDAAYDSCGPAAGERCRHGIRLNWMQTQPR